MGIVIWGIAVHFMEDAMWLVVVPWRSHRAKKTQPDQFLFATVLFSLMPLSGCKVVTSEQARGIEAQAAYHSEVLRIHDDLRANTKLVIDHVTEWVTGQVTPGYAPWRTDLYHCVKAGRLFTR